MRWKAIEIKFRFDKFQKAMECTYLRQFTILTILTVKQSCLVSPQIDNSKNASNLSKITNRLMEYLNMQAVLFG